MRRTVFIFLIVAVITVMGIYTFLEFRVSEIVFVTDKTDSWAYGKEMAVRRLYNSNVDIDAFTAKVEQALISAEFTEDELYAAALTSGTPEFYPAFYFSTYNPEPQKDVFDFSAAISQEFAPNQTNFNFMLSNIHLEIISTGPTVSDIKLTAENQSEKHIGTPVLSDDKRSLALDYTNISGYSLTLTGVGSVTIQYTYDIVTNSLFSSGALTGQLLIVHANISRDADGEFQVEYIAEPYSSLEDYETG